MLSVASAILMSEVTAMAIIVMAPISEFVTVEATGQDKSSLLLLLRSM